MNTWTITVRYDRWCMAERICPHGVGHPDPDSIEWMKRTIFQDQDGIKNCIYDMAGGSIHGCDGCCRDQV